MKFLMISSFLPSVLNFRGKLLEAIHHQSHEIHIIAPDLELFQPEMDKLKSLGYSVYSVEMQRTGTNPIADI
ncbi:glycosyltransferase family 1 protein, partial [Acinetobacter baumannii]|nr:glycosyltransferase family 1 protein [Acinetobacter baumannii]